MNNGLKIILVDQNTGRSAILRRALQDAGHEVICRLESSKELVDSNEATHADAIILNTDIPDDQIFANLNTINQTKPKPIVMFTNESDSIMASDAVRSGVNAYIIDGLEESRVQGIINIAIARFREFQALKDELDSTRTQLNERKVVEKAKGILMHKNKMSEDEAYNALRKMAMDKNIKIAAVAKSVVEVADLLG